MKLNKKLIIFLIVFLLLIISIIYRLSNPFMQARTDTLTFTGKKNITVSHSADKGLNKEKQTLVSRFLNKPKISGKIYKDLFSLHKPSQTIGVKKENLVPAAVATSGENPLLEAKDYIASYTFYGTFESEGTTSVFLAKDKMVLVARTGDLLDGKYLIEEIKGNHIKFKVLDVNETIQLDIGEFNNE